MDVRTAVKTLTATNCCGMKLNFLFPVTNIRFIKESIMLRLVKCLVLPPTNLHTLAISIPHFTASFINPLQPQARCVCLCCVCVCVFTASCRERDEVQKENCNQSAFRTSGCDSTVVSFVINRGRRLIRK